jgi:hypothetical protein
LNCGVSNAGQTSTGAGVAGQAEIVISRDGIEFWRFICVRPSASSGSNRSGIELRDVKYRGKMVLSRANAPILNVQYERNSCGPFRDWLYQEGMFDAPGTDIAAGIRICTAPPGSVLDTGTDFGNYRGVAIWDREEVRLVSEMEAGWYRYISEWRFHDNGVIEPLFGYGATTNSCVCRNHTHHVYWRLDFDLATAANNNVYSNLDGNRKQIENESMSPRNGTQQTWVLDNAVTGEAVVIVPGANDGNADKYGVGDIWFLLNHFPSEIDDAGQPPNPAPYNFSTGARLIPMINGESIVGQDIVVWYAGHWRHDSFNEPVGGQAPHGAYVQGPELRLMKY